MKTNKSKEKNYVAPSVRVIEVEESAVICTSNERVEEDESPYGW